MRKYICSFEYLNDLLHFERMMCCLRGIALCVNTSVCFGLGPVNVEWEREYLWFGASSQVGITDHQICTHLQIPSVSSLTYRWTCMDQSFRGSSDSYFIVKRTY